MITFGEGSLVTHACYVMNHLLFIPYGHFFKTMFYSFSAKCFFLFITSLVWGFQNMEIRTISYNLWEEEPFSEAAEMLLSSYLNCGEHSRANS